MNNQHLSELKQICKNHNDKPFIVRNSWLMQKNTEIILKDTVSTDLNFGKRVSAQIVPVWSNYSISGLDSMGYQEIEELANEYYTDLDKPTLADIWKANYKIIFVTENWQNGTESVSDNLATIE